MPTTTGSAASTRGSTSRSLLERVRAKDEGSWERIVDLYAPLVLYWCRRERLPDDDAADVFQDVFATVAKKIDGFRRDRPGDTFRGWLRAITRSKVVDRYRRERREPVGVGGSSVLRRWNELPASDEVASAGPGEESALRGLLHRGLERVRPHFHARTWDAFWATAVQGRPNMDVADELGMSPGAVRVAKSRVLQRLRSELGELPDGPGGARPAPSEA